jgi:protocatechuate 3,4-dioxygenase beta subunit
MTEHDHDRGLVHDLRVLSDFAARRRALLKWGLGVSASPLLACGRKKVDDGTSNTSTGGDSTGPRACSKIPEETAGPFPGDGTNGKNALTLADIVRSDIRSSLAGATGVADGVVLTLTLTIVGGANGCAPLAGQAVYLWHCDRDGNYSMYSTAAVNENYLRGVQETDDSGQVTFTTIFPGCYPGRWPHMHFEIYPSLAAASSGESAIVTSQLALPETSCVQAYAAEGYASSATNLTQVTLASDGVFSDGADLETATTSGDADSGFVATLSITI